MDNLDVAEILTTYSEKAKNVRSAEHLKDIIRELKQELDLRKINQVVVLRR